MTDEERLRREGMADAVLRIVAARTLLHPLTRAQEVADVVGLTRADLAAALQRLRDAHGEPEASEPERRWEVFDRRTARYTPVDELIFEAVCSLVDATGLPVGPTQVRAWLAQKGERVPYTTVAQSLAKQATVGRLERPMHGKYRRAAA